MAVIIVIVIMENTVSAYRRYLCERLHKKKGVLNEESSI